MSAATSLVRSFPDIPRNLSILFPAAAIIQCEVVSFHPRYSLWKNLIAARYPLTVDCWLLNENSRQAMNSSKSVSTSDLSNNFNHGPLPFFINSSHLFHFPRNTLCGLPPTDGRTRDFTKSATSALILPLPSPIPDKPRGGGWEDESLNIMHASAESLHGHQVNRKMSLSPTTCCDEEQCFWFAAPSRRGVPLAPRSIAQISRRCLSTVSPRRLVLIGTSVKYRPLTCSGRLEYVLHRTSNPLGFQDGRAFSSSDLRAYP